MPEEQVMDFPFPSSSRGEDVSGPLSIAFEATLVLANILPIFVVCKYKHPNTRIATDELILALCITDMLSVIIPSPIGLVSYFSHGWYGGKRTCDFYQLTIVWFQLTSMCLVTFMCLDRWMSLRDAMLYKTGTCKHKRIRLAVLGIYIFTLLVSSLPLLGLAPTALSSSGKLCQSWLVSEPELGKERVFYLIFLTLGFSNLLITVIVNSTLVVTLWQFQKKFGTKPAERMSSAAMQIDKRTVVELTVMILIVTIVFYLAWLPALLMVTLQRFGVAVQDAAVMYSLLSTTLTGLLNPVIYGVFSRSYRRGYTRIIVAICKLFFGCPISQEDVINDISSQARRMRTGGSTNASLAALISRESDITSDAGSSHPSQLIIGSISDLCISPSQESHSSLLTTNDAGSVCGANCRIGCHPTCSDAVDMHERTYIDTIMQRDKHPMTVGRDMYGSSLSLISEDSAGDMSVSSDSVDCRPQHVVCSRHPRITQESMI